MTTRQRHDRLFVLGLFALVAGQFLKRWFPDVLVGPGVVQALYLVGMGIFTVFFLVSLFAIARSRLPVRAQLVWIGALVILAPLATPLAYHRFVRSRAAASP